MEGECKTDRDRDRGRRKDRDKDMIKGSRAKERYKG